MSVSALSMPKGTLHTGTAVWMIGSLSIAGCGLHMAIYEQTKETSEDISRERNRGEGLGFAAAKKNILIKQISNSTIHR